MSFSFSNFVSTRRAKTGQDVLYGPVAFKFAPITSVDVQRTFSL